MSIYAGFLPDNEKGPEGGQRVVEDALAKLGWDYWHLTTKGPTGKHSAMGATGFLDIHAVRGPRILWAEIKGWTTPDRHSQLDMMVGLLKAAREGSTVEVYRWKAREITVQEIGVILAARTRPPETDRRHAELAALIPTLRAKAR